MTDTTATEWDILDVDLLDDCLERLTELGVSHHELIGKKVIWHDNRRTTVVINGDTIALRKRLHCHRCGKLGITVYFHSGLHRGAWCYAYNKRGKYLANMRDQNYVCVECNQKESKRAAIGDLSGSALDV